MLNWLIAWIWLALKRVLLLVQNKNLNQNQYPNPNPKQTMFRQNARTTSAYFKDRDMPETLTLNHHFDNQTKPVSPDTFIAALQIETSSGLIMTSLETTNSNNAHDASLDSGNAPTLNGSDKASKPANTPSSEGKNKKKDVSKDDTKAKDVSNIAKLSGAELKKKAKEEKAAKRAREKQNQQPPQSLAEKSQAANNVIQKAAIVSASATSTPKNQHKRAGSVSANAQKPLVLRPAETQSVAAAPEPKKESKKVALFGHLYGNSRRTTIAGAGRDVHPAVLALGLQMSNYVICGSNARCVAMLLVFKRVSERFLTRNQCISDEPLGDRVICHTSSEFCATPPPYSFVFPD